MKTDIDTITRNLELRDGIWYSKDSAAISYPKEANERCYQLEEDSFWFKHRNKCIIETVKRFTPEGVLLDLGGGNGYVASGLEAAGLHTVLVEPGAQGVLNAKKRGLSNIICSTFENLKPAENSLDAVGIFDVLEHIREDNAFIEMIYKYLKPGGVLYITVPAFNFLWSKEDESAGHYRRYTLSSLERILRKNHFRTLYKTYIFSFLPIPVFLFRTLPGRLGLNKNPRDFQKHQKAHAQDKGLLNSFVNRLLSWEQGKIRGGKKIPVGGSCFFAVQKPLA